MEQALELLEKLALRTVTYISNDLGLAGLENEISIKEVSEFETLNISTMITLSGSIKGRICLSTDKEFAYKMVENAVFGELPKDELQALAVENVAETLNIVLGNILMELENSVEISAPKIFQESIRVKKSDYKKIYLCKLQYEKEQIILSYFE